MSLCRKRLPLRTRHCTALRLAHAGTQRFFFGPFVVKKTMTTHPILTVKNLSVVFPDSNGGLHALENISFEVCPRDFICFLGPSGSGKTTLLRILAGLLKPSSGQVDFIHNQQPRIGMVFQQAISCPGAR